MKLLLALTVGGKSEETSYIRVGNGIGKSLFVKTFLMIIKRLWLI